MSEYPEKDKRRKMAPQRPTIILIEILIIVLAVVLIGRSVLNTPPTTVTTVMVTPTPDANAIFEQAQLLRDAEQYNDSIPVYTQALEAGYTPASLAYFGRAYSYFEIDYYNVAIENYNRAIETDPNCEYECPYHYFNRGLAYYELENYDKAILDMTAALEMRPDYVNALRFRAKIYMKQGNLEQGLLDWQRFFELQENGIIERGLPAEGGTQTALLDETGQQLHITFDGTAGTRVTLRTTDSDFDPILLLLNDAGTPLAFDDDSGTGGNNARISNVALPETGKYHIWVAAYDEDETGSVTLVMATGMMPVPSAEFPTITRDNVTLLAEASQFTRLDDDAGAFSPDGRFFYESATTSGIVRYTLADTAPRYEQVVMPAEYYPAIAAGDNDHYLAVAAGDDAILYDIIENKRLLVMYDAEISMTDLAFSPDMSLLAGASISDKIYLWDTVTGEPVFTLRSNNSVANRVAFSPDGQWLAVGGTSGELDIWNAQTGKLVTNWVAGEDSEILALAFSPDNAVIAAGDETGTVWVWAVPTGELLSRIATNSQINTLVFSPDGHLIAAGNQRGEIGLYPVTEANLLHTLAAHEKPVQNLMFALDGATLYSAGADDTVRVWRITAK